MYPPYYAPPMHIRRPVHCMAVVMAFLLYSGSIFAQSARSIQGDITDEKGNKVPGVTVLIKGTKTGTGSDEKGHYIIQVPAGKDTLAFSFIGYLPQDITIGNRSTINVQMKPNSATLNDVVVVGFGTQKKTSLVSSVTSINPKEIKGPTSNLTTMLAGRISGIISFQRSGEPGADNAQFFIRGVGSFGTGKVNPLIMIDGIESDNTALARLQADDISGFSILKDATASSIYGARGANGVVLVTTKQGESGKTKFNFRIENSTSANTQNFKMADNITYMRLANEASLTRNALGAAPYSQNKIDHTAAGDDPLLYPNNDWIKQMLKDYTSNQRYNMNVSGGGEKLQYYLAMTYNIDNGMLKVAPINDFNSNIKLRNYSVLSNVTLNLTKSTKALVSLKGQFDDYNGPVGGGSKIVSSVLTANPVSFPAIYPQSYLPYAKHPLFGNAIVPGTTRSLFANPYAEAVRGYQQSNKSTLTAQLQLTQDMSALLQGLNARLMAYTTRYSAFDVARQYNPFYYQAYTEDSKSVAGINQLNNNIPGIGQIGDQAPTEYLDYTPGERKQNTTTYIETQLSYGNTFGKHNVTGMLIGRMFNYLEGGVTSLQLSLPKRNLGVSGRFTYGYDDRYLAEFNFGYNGSERFAQNNRYGFFPSIGAGWIVSNEKFFEGLHGVVDNLKFRATFGLVGNDQIGRDEDRFFFLSQVNLNDLNRGAIFGERMGYSRPGVSTSRYGNNNVTWELSKQLNYGMDLTIFNAFTFTIDGYRNKRTNILMTRADIPSTVGLQVIPQANTGEAQSSGIDVALDYKKSYGTTAWVQARGTFTYATSKLLVNEEPDFGPGRAYLSQVGHSLKQRWGFIAERLFIDEKDVANSPRQFGDYMAGDIKYRDVSGDGQITSDDIVPIGLPEYPEILYGFGFSAGYKAFDFSMFFQGSARSSFSINSLAVSPFISGPVDPLDNNKVLPIGYQSGLLDVIAQDHWSEDNRNAYAFWPRLSNTYVTNNVQSSTWWLQNGSFLRLKTAELGYNFPRPLLKRIGIYSGRIYLNGMNLLTFSKFKLWDPEMGGNGLGYPVQRVYNIGALIGF
ncbi:TonB-linked outer membrane protein, SusC/RagA family [Chitinophaga arvensicola]|uniref:TonB-linked outer membrane protein, SusC/RagA family n=2 Tax=Chitinophaga arvensicola TaxID=29529 RepID=A0A1I0RSW0_9BACT|nr:TonB-linked outer membrane protein, SusC/RagA family [Chitinophaga arvensicola]